MLFSHPSFQQKARNANSLLQFSNAISNANFQCKYQCKFPMQISFAISNANFQCNFQCKFLMQFPMQISNANFQCKFHLQFSLHFSMQSPLHTCLQTNIQGPPMQRRGKSFASSRPARCIGGVLPSTARPPLARLQAAPVRCCPGMSGAIQLPTRTGHPPPPAASATAAGSDSNSSVRRVQLQQQCEEGPTAV